MLRRLLIALLALCTGGSAAYTLAATSGTPSVSAKAASVVLSWSNISISNRTGYYVSEDGVRLASVKASPYTVTGSLACGSAHTFGVRPYSGSTLGTVYTTTYQAPDCPGATTVTQTVTQTETVPGPTVTVTVTTTTPTTPTTTTTTGTTGTTTTPVSGPLNGIRAQGSQLVDDSGQVIHLHGVDAEGTEYQCAHDNGIFDTSNGAQNAADMAAWHVNFVRIGLNALCVDCALGVSAQDCGSNYMQPIEDWVRELNSYGIYAEVMLMWDLPGADNAVGLTAAQSYQVPGGPTAEHAPQAWQTMAQDFKDNPNVILGVWGEDYIDWGCKLNGGPSCGGVQGSVETTTLAAGISGSPSSVAVSGLSYTLIPGEPVWLGAPSTSVPGAADTLTVAGNVPIQPSIGMTSIPVTGTLAHSYASGAKLYYSNADPGNATGVTPWLPNPANSSPAIDWSTPSAGAQQAVNIMRQAGFTGPIAYSCADAADVCSDPNTAGGSGQYYGGTWLTSIPTDPLNEIVAQTDFYGPSGYQVCTGTTCLDNTIKPIIAAGHPVIFGEFGPSVDGSACTASDYVSPLLSWADANGVAGYAAWSWFTNGGSCLDLINSYTSAAPNSSSAYAQGVNSYYLAHWPTNP